MSEIVDVRAEDANQARLVEPHPDTGVEHRLFALMIVEELLEQFLQ